MDNKAKIETLVLQTLSKENIDDTFKFAAKNDLDHQSLVGVIKSLLVEAHVTSQDLATSFYSIEAPGRVILANNVSPEYAFITSFEDMTIGKSKGDVDMGCMGMCMKLQWITMNKTDGKIYRIKNTEELADTVLTQLNAIHAQAGALTSITEAEAKVLKRRKFIKEETRRSLSVGKGPNFCLERKVKAAGLNKAILDKGEWKDESHFKPYNFNALGFPVGGGHLHPLMKVRTEYRRVLMDMGFNEMPTNRFVESSFWNFDALFQPQSHPARDAHDTFFLKDPQACHTIPEEYYNRVKDMHEHGGHGSIGHGKGAFTRQETEKNILRTHTTAVSARMLHALANQPGGFTPQKYFSIDRVFRNESMDATHLAEFHQVEGVVADYDLSLGDLIGVISEFFLKIGMTDVKFKPAYNPYTEPSMEIFAFHPDLNKWTEVGNSGVFRPEMLLPMGLPPNARVIAWGLSLERPTMIKYRINNIRDLFGHKIDLEQTKAAKLYRM